MSVPNNSPLKRHNWGTARFILLASCSIGMAYMHYQDRYEKRPIARKTINISAKYFEKVIQAPKVKLQYASGTQNPSFQNIANDIQLRDGIAKLVEKDNERSVTIAYLLVNSTSSHEKTITDNVTQCLKACIEALQSDVDNIKALSNGSRPISLNPDDLITLNTSNSNYQQLTKGVGQPTEGSNSTFMPLVQDYLRQRAILLHSVFGTIPTSKPTIPQQTTVTHNSL